MTDAHDQASPSRTNQRLAVLTRIEPVLRGWVNVHRVEVLMPDGAVVERHVEDHGSGVAVLPYNRERGTVLLIEQPRAPVLMAGGEDLLEAIAGRLDGCAPEDRIRQEALEEGGVKLDSLEPVIHLWSMPSISTERLHLFLAPYRDEDRVGAGGGCHEEHENILVREVALIGLAEKAASGRLADAKTLILFMTLQARHPELFQTGG